MIWDTRHQLPDMLQRRHVESYQPIVLTDDGPTGVRARDCDLSKFVDTYGFGPKVTPEQGFPLFIDWLRGTDDA